MIDACSALIALVTLALPPADTLRTDTATLASYYSADAIFRFAGNLKDQGDYERAAAEYERLLFLKSPQYSRPLVIEQIAQCQASQGAYTEAARWYHTLCGESVSSADSIRFGMLELGMLYRIARYRSVVDRCDSLGKTADARIPAVRTAALLHLNEIDQARISAAETQQCHGTDSSIPAAARAWVAEYASLPQKSAAVAGALSAMVPGAGKVYVGRTKDGFLALMLTAFFGWQAWDGYTREGISSFKGNACAALGGAFYLSNIYGSVIAVRVCNQQRKDATLKKIDMSVQMQLP